MLEIKGLTGGYVNIPVLKDISFTVGNGELVGLIGLVEWVRVNPLQSMKLSDF